MLRSRWMSPGRVALLSLSVVLGVLSLAFPAPASGAAGRVEHVTMTSGEQGREVRIRTSRPLRYRSQLIGRPQRLVLDFEEAALTWREGPLQPASGPITEVRGGQFRPGVARIVIVLARAVPHTIEGTPEGLRVVLRDPEPDTPSAAARARVEPSASAAIPAGDPAARPILFGIVLRGEDSIAYMEDPGTRRVTGFKLGDLVGGGVLEVIEERHVAIRMPAGLVEVRVDGPKPGHDATAPRLEVGSGAEPR
jgi:hypothetical protein